MIDLGKVYRTLGVLAALCLGYVLWRNVERRAGAREALYQTAVKDDVTVIRGAEATIAAMSGRLRVDTVRLTTLVDHRDSLVALSGALAAAREALAHVPATGPAHATVTVHVPAALVIADDSTIRACRITVSDCEQYGAAQKARGDAYAAQLGKVQALAPSPLVPHLGLGLAAGINASGKLDAVAGLTLSWKLP